MRELHSLGLRWTSSGLSILDQTLLPHREEWINIENSEQMIQCIRQLKVRGAPLIGVAAALSLALDSKKGRSNLKELSQALRASRPTAVNLMNALDRMNQAEDMLAEAIQIFDEEVEASRAMARMGQDFVTSDVLTHCNTGGLATVGTGTALAIPIEAFERGKKVHVYVDETRPLLQGARLNVWELNKRNISCTLICDNMAGALMASGRVGSVFVGADRIALNGDFANKIGTYSLAVLAHHHHVPFYVVAPTTTIDGQAASAQDIPIEHRAAEEILNPRGVSVSLEGTQVWNPAFDHTPASLVTALITEKFVATKSDLSSGKLKEFLRG